jgi:hypothetical protein
LSWTKQLFLNWQDYLFLLFLSPSQCFNQEVSFALMALVVHLCYVSYSSCCVKHATHPWLVSSCLYPMWK